MLDTRPPPRQARGAAKRALILDAAERLLARVPPAALTTTQVATAAGVPVGSIYRYFANADALLAALFARMNEGTSAALGAGAAEDWRAALARVARVVRAMHDAHPAYGALMTYLQARGAAGDRIPDAVAARLVREAGLSEARAALVAGTLVALFEGVERRHHVLPEAERDAAWAEGMRAVEAYLASVL